MLTCMSAKGADEVVSEAVAEHANGRGNFAPKCLPGLRAATARDSTLECLH